MGGLTGEPGTRAKTSGEAAEKWGEGNEKIAAKPLVDASSPRLSRFSPHFTRSCTTRFGPALPPSKTASYAG